MLLIRDAQMRAFSTAMRERFVSECLAYAEAKFPDKVVAMGRPDARVLVRRAIDRAKDYGIDKPPEVRRFIDLVFRFGSDFDTRPDLASTFDALQDAKLEPALRLRLIDTRLEAAAQSAARATAQAAAIATALAAQDAQE